VVAVRARHQPAAQEVPAGSTESGAANNNCVPADSAKGDAANPAKAKGDAANNCAA
jgi:hypothetical protein